MKKLLPLALLLFTACGPVYRTNYTLNEPATDVGRLCSKNVIEMSNTCLQGCQQMARKCEDAGRFGTSMTLGSGGQLGMYQTLGDQRDCSPRQCEETCLAAARKAHINCGGTVTEETVCTANCDQAK